MLTSPDAETSSLPEELHVEEGESVGVRVHGTSASESEEDPIIPREGWVREADGVLSRQAARVLVLKSDAGAPALVPPPADGTVAPERDARADAIADAPASAAVGRADADAGTQLLVVGGHDAKDLSRHWLFTPGGGVEAGESPREAALRELREEAGIRAEESELLGPALRRISRLEFASHTARQYETFYVYYASADTVISEEAWTEHEREVLDGLSWRTASALRELREAGAWVFPSALPELIDELAGGWDGRCHEINEWA